MKQPRLITVCILLVLIAALRTNQAPVTAQSLVDLAVHYIEGVPSEDEASYNVTVYLSVVDGSGIPIRDLNRESFSVAEDSQKVDIANLGLVTEEPVNIILVLDTSGSMVGTSITDAKAAATTFISGLKPNDQVAIITFDTYFRTQIDFTTNRKSLTDRIALIDATRDSGTCLYDAAFSAVQMASTLRSGSRAVILFTDGIDETATGAICSAHTADDVINLAKENATRTPVYTLGMGTRFDAQTLKRIADLTGGLYLYASGSSQLANVFQLLSDQLRSQYVLTYQSIAAPGSHSLTVSVNHLGLQDFDTRNFFLPALPTRIIFATPLEGETVSNRVKLAVSLISQGEIVQRVVFLVNGAEVGFDDTKPYELDLELKPFPTGVMTVSAIAYGENDIELTRNSLNLVHTGSAVEPVIVPPTEILPTLGVEPVAEPQSSSPAMGIILGGLGVVVIAVVLVLLLRQQKQAKNAADEFEAAIDNFTTIKSPPVYREIKADRPASSYRVDSDALGVLTIAASDDESLIGHQFEILAASVTLGRSADNDLNFPNDKPVSRHHAELYQSNGKLYLRALETPDAAGVPQTPKYGTFLNQIPLGSDPVLLNSGDEIQLGKRVRLKFEAYARAGADDEMTYDDMTAETDPDKTLDS